MTTAHNPRKTTSGLRLCPECGQRGDGFYCHHWDAGVERRVITHLTEIPKKGQLWKHPSLRGLWRIKSAGPAFVTLTPTIPTLRPKRIPTSGFLKAAWEPFA